VELKEMRVIAKEDAPAVIEGHASVFGQWSEWLGNFFPFKEKVKAGAFLKSIGKDDIRALWNHDSLYVLGRNRAGTLELNEDEQGLFVRIFPPETQWAKDLCVSIKRGDVSQMSIGFEVVKDKWSTEDGADVRELIEVKLYDVSPVTFPAYTTTDVGVRGLESYKELLDKRNKDAADDKARESAKNRQKINNIKTKIKII
jgi:HK97 family phage prohead protease